MNTQQTNARLKALTRFDELLQRLRGQLADSTGDFAYKIIRDYANELGDIRASLSEPGGGVGVSTQQTNARLEALAPKWRVQNSQEGQGPAGNKARRRCADELDELRASLPEPQS